MIRPVLGGCWGEARFACLRIQGDFQWHGYPDPVSVETCSCAQTYSQRGISGLCTKQIVNLQCGASVPLGAVTLCADVACLAWGGWMREQRGAMLWPERQPRSPFETRSAKEAKEADGLWWKSPRLFRRGRKRIAVRTKWQSGSIAGNTVLRRRRGNRLHRQREVRRGEIQPVPKP